MIAYDVDDIFFSILETGKFVIFFDYHEAPLSSLIMAVGIHKLDYTGLNLKIKHF